MHLQRIQVPDFRVLKDVDITFEKEFVPSIFPLGSLNGGGKSTLLQLIFVLLHCSADPDKTVFLKNMLNGFKIHEDTDKRVLAIAEIWDGKKSVKLNFFACKDFYIRELLSKNEKGKAHGYEYLSFSVFEKLKEVQDRILSQKIQIRKIENSLNRLDFNTLKEIKSDEERLSLFTEEIRKLQAVGLPLVATIPNSKNIYSSEEYIEVIKDELELLQLALQSNKIEQREMELASKKVFQYLKENKLIYICNYSDNKKENESEEKENEGEVLLCQIDNLDINQAKYFLKELSQKVFFAAPSTQVFLFISQTARKFLFRDMSTGENNNYYLELQAAKSKLKTFFAYDFLPVDLIVESCKNARDRDFREAIETGEYGNNYQELIKELNLVLVNKKINLKADVSGVIFKLDRDGEDIELQPEDLSHGELKRLSIYLWIKYHNIENAIVLMDEIEIAFHPDWQYQIISDLQQWAPNNQYILATHSYELCQALTPSHVKELDPKLIKNQEA